MSFWDSVGTFVSKNAGSIIGGGLGAIGNYLQGQSAIDAANVQAQATNQAANQALAAAAPWDVVGPGAQAGFNDSQATLGLAPELQDIYAGAIGRQGLWGQQAANIGFNPFEAQDYFYQQQRELAAPEEERMRSALETRLAAQGRLGTTGGALEQEAFTKGLADSHAQQRHSALTQSQALIDNLLGRESADIGTAQGLLNIPLQYAALGRGIGGDLGSAASSGLAARASAASNFANTQAAAGTPMGGLFSGVGNNLALAALKGK